MDLPSLWNSPACWLSLCEEIVEGLDMPCGHGNLQTLGCCTSWHQLAPAGPRWVKQPIKTLMHTTLFMGIQAITPPLHPSLSPHTHRCHCPIHRNTNYIFFFLFFGPFSDQCYRDSLYPTFWVLKPLPLHHIIPTLMPCPLSLASPHCHLCLTACKPSCLHLCHMQVHHHCHPVTVHKIHPQCQLATCKPHHDTIPTQHARPTTMSTCHTYAPLWCHLNTEHKTPTLPTHRT